MAKDPSSETSGSQDPIDSLEREKLEIEKERLRLEKRRTESESYFSGRHGGALIAAAVSVIGVAVSGAQVWVAHVTKDKELALQKSQDDTKLQNERDERDRRWKLDMATFVFTHKADIFTEDAARGVQVRNVMLATFPLSITDALFQRIESAVPEQQKQIWRDGQRAIDRVFASSPAEGDAMSGSSRTVGASIQASGDVADDLSRLPESLQGNDRQQVSRRLARAYSDKPVEIVTALVNAILPESNPWSYRVNLYISLTLGRIVPSWSGTQGQLELARSLVNTSSYKNDQTFRETVDRALKNYRRAGDH
jgi:hypothetical protein